MAEKIAVIIPAFNEAPVLQDTVASVRRVSPTATIVVVDDGSTDGTQAVAYACADVVLSHRKNCGLGAAIMTGLEYAKREGYTSCITFDADGQHDAADIPHALQKITDGYDVVVGSRFRGSHSGMPRARRFVLLAGNIVTFLFFGVWTSDSQSGFRAFSRRAIETIYLKSNRMEVSSELYGEIHRLHLKYTEIPIHIRYTKYSLGKGQRNANGLKILLKLLYRL